MSNKKEYVIFSLIIQLFFAFTLIVFGPYEIFISNTSDFSFTFKNFGWMLPIIAVLYISIATFICAIFPRTFGNIYNALIFAFTLCSYIQTMFLNGKMKVLIGEEVKWDLQTNILNLVVWIAVFIIVFLLKHFLKDNWKKLTQFISVALIAMQLATLIFLFASTDVLSEKKEGYVSQEGMLELSPKNNVIVFILDFFDGVYMDGLLSEDPDFLQPLTGFTYFPNATSVHSRTYPSITYLLTGNMCYFDNEPAVYINDAFKNSDFLPSLYDKKIDVGLYTFGIYLGNDAKNHMRNFEPSDISLKFSNTVKYMIQIELYRSMPYIVKPYFSYDTNNINNNVRAYTETDPSKNIEPEYQNFNDEWFYEALTTDGVSIAKTEGSFRFYHLGSCHLNLSDPIPFGKRSLEIVYDYLSQLQALGLYKDATIIITADHGSSGSGETLDMPHETAVPLLIVKQAGEDYAPIMVSEASVSHTDFIPTILEGFSLDYSDYGYSVFDIEENADRDRYYYYSALYSDEDGEIELREYKVSGDARNRDSYHFTGNTWDIISSLNKVFEK